MVAIWRVGLRPNRALGAADRQRRLRRTRRSALPQTTHGDELEGSRPADTRMMIRWRVGLRPNRAGRATRAGASSSAKLTLQLGDWCGQLLFQKAVVQPAADA
jgi:hypothetical protein